MPNVSEHSSRCPSQLSQYIWRDICCIGCHFSDYKLIIVSLSLPFSDNNDIVQLEEYAHIGGLDDDL
jgi:hypothetical protein